MTVTTACRLALATCALVGVGCAESTPVTDLPDSSQSTDSTRSLAFRQDLSERLESAGAQLTVQGTDGWLFFGPELRHLTAGEFWGERAAAVSQASSSEHADPLPAIIDFNDQLQARGVELVVVPVPAKATIYPAMISGSEAARPDGPSRLDEHDSAFYDVLRAAGVPVLDLTEPFLQAVAGEPDPLYCRQDTHWAGAGCIRAAAILAELIRDRPWFADVPKATYDAETRQVEIAGDLWRFMDDASLPKETLSLRFVGTRGQAGLEAVPDDPASPIVLLGDSHGLVFHVGGDMHAQGAGLADQLAYELGFALDVVAVRGSGATPARFNLFRRARRTPGFWDAKRLVIWTFSVREFTEADGWRRVPIDAP